MIFAAYRKDQFADPDSFMAQVALVFADYEDEALIAATDPADRGCIQCTHKWPPSLQELRVALDSFQKSLDARRFIAEKNARGFFWDAERGVFINAKGERDTARNKN